MKKNKNLKRKIATVLCAAVLPMSIGGMVLSFVGNSNAQAATEGASYLKSYVKEISLSNSNFNSSSSSYTLSNTLSGWNGQVNDGKTTAGIISTGSSFQTYFDTTFHLSSNPLSKASDKYILMINSKTKSVTDSSDIYNVAKQGYKSSSVTLAANSYYSFQVSFKSDTNYKARKTYLKKGEIDADTTISKTTFNGGSDTSRTGFGEYISFTYKNKTYYLLKQLTKTEQTLSAQEGVSVFYEDEEFVGIMHENAPIYVSLEDVVDGSVTENKVDIKDGAKVYTCNIEYNPNGGSNGNYNVPKNTDYFEQTNEYDPVSATSFGSIYLSGLKDEDGNDVKAEYVQISSKDWTTFQFFVATGNEQQTVNLELWLGAKNITTSGVVFFDDCHVMQYSENAFWKAYRQNFGNSYSQDFTNGDQIETISTDCTSLVDLRKDKTLDFSSHNFDFEAGIYHDNISSLQDWTKDEQGGGNARIFDVNNAEYFKSVTGYDFVGSTLSCVVNLNGEKVELLKENNYVLGLWANDNSVKVTSKDVDVSANEIYKIKAYYKVAELSSGSAYMFVQENENVLSTYDLTSSQYSVAAQTASSAVSTNSSNEFANNYGVIEFYVKGGALYNSSINISLGLGNGSENATGCVLFDNVTIEKASSEEFSSASNKVELGTISATPSISNGNFNNVTISKDDTRPYSPNNWTLSKGNGTAFGGVISTDSIQYEEYVRLYEELKDKVSFENNPYYWASWANPGSANNNQSDNVLMLANITKTWQKVKSDSFSLNAGTTYKLSFDFKTYALAASSGFKVTLFDENGFKLYESKNLSSANAWENFEIYIKSSTGASKAYLEIDFDNTDGDVCNLAYFDNFRLDSNVSAPEVGEIVDLTNFYLNLPTNNITTDEKTSTTPAYSGSISSGSASNMSGGIVKSEAFDQNSNFTIYKDANKTEIDKDQNVFFIQSQTQGAYVLQSNFNVDMTSGNYYKLSFKLKTYFNDENLDSEKTYSYGATVGLTGFKYMTQLKAGDEYQEYSIFFHPTADASGKLYFALVCDTNETAGALAIYDVQFEQSTEDEFSDARTTTQKSDFDINKDKVFISSADESTDDDSSSDTDPDTTPATQSFDWLLIPSLIFGVAIVIAVVGYFLRKIKIKKIEIKKRESYDRKTSLNVDAIKLKARKEQEANIAEVQNTVDKFEKELENLEREHKQKVVTLRENDKNEVSKATDKEFKRFAQKRTVISEKIDSLKKQISDMQSAEYLLNLERKIYAQDEMKQRTLEKASKKANKAQEKAVKTVSKADDKSSKNNKKK